MQTAEGHRSNYPDVNYSPSSTETDLDLEKSSEEEETDLDLPVPSVEKENPRELVLLALQGIDHAETGYRMSNLNFPDSPWKLLMEARFGNRLLAPPRLTRSFSHTPENFRLAAALEKMALFALLSREERVSILYLPIKQKW